jgi:YHS domain-containing protein
LVIYLTILVLEICQLCIVKTVHGERFWQNQYNVTRPFTFYREPTNKMKSLLNFTFLILLTFQGFSQDASIRKKEFLLDKGTAISGYDPTAYFSGKTQKGKKEFSYTQEGVNYLFANANNLETFKKNPAKYEPQYGGWCAFAMGSKGEKVEVDPETFKIVNGKLYLFYHTFFSNTLTDWNKDENALKTKADVNWSKHIKK